MILSVRGREISLVDRSFLMGILNVTPDSFSDGGRYVDPGIAVKHAVEMIADGAAIIDIGGESTRPGAETLSADEEIDRVVPVIRQLKQEMAEVLISIDTTKGAVAYAALEAGADIVNDISGLQADCRLAEIAAEFDAGLMLMHMRGTPKTMQNPENLVYDDVVDDVILFLEQAIDQALAAKIRREAIVVDPGIGFAKTWQQNLALLNRIDEFNRLGVPLLVGPSRKSFIGHVLDEADPAGRIWGTAGVIAWLLAKRVSFLRVHDVREMQQVITMFNACRNPGRLSEEAVVKPV